MLPSACTDCALPGAGVRVTMRTFLLIGLLAACSSPRSEQADPDASILPDTTAVDAVQDTSAIEVSDLTQADAVLDGIYGDIGKQDDFLATDAADAQQVDSQTKPDSSTGCKFGATECLNACGSSSCPQASEQCSADKDCVLFDSCISQCSGFPFRTRSVPSNVLRQRASRQ